MASLGLDRWNSTDVVLDCGTEEQWRQTVKEAVQQREQQIWEHDINSRPKLRTYFTFKDSLTP